MVDVLGTRLGRYDIRERIGRGGMASVYKAWDTTLERWVAVKVLHDHLADEEDFKERFQREARLVASLNHPNIVQVYDFDIAERGSTPVYYMVMAYVEGASLRRRMERKHELGERMTLAESAVVMRGVCSALAFAHGRGMVHRDVTPGNILFSEHEQVVLADFGIARMITGTRLTQSGTTSGTPIYMSPEQGMGEAGDHRSDIYSVGVILYEMLTGAVPYDGDSTFAIMMKHVNDPVPSPLAKNPTLPQAIESIVFRAMAKDPDERYQNIDEMLVDFEGVLAQNRGATLVLNRTTPMTARRHGRKLRAALPIALTFAALAVVALVAALLILPRLTGSDAAPTPTDEAMVTLAVPPLRPRSFAPSMTAGPFLFSDNFGPDRGQLIWPITTDDPAIHRTIEDGVYRIRHTLRATAVTTIFNEEYVEYGAGFVFQADFTLSTRSQADSATGIVFRYRSDDDYYVFAVNGQGQISLWRRQAGAWTELRGLATAWTPAESARPAGETNRLTLMDAAERLRGFVNDELVIDIQHRPTILAGGTGIYLATTVSPVAEPLAEVFVDNFSVEAVRLPTRTPSPTVPRTPTTTVAPTATPA
jgi:tRNA A-37 threonylcarbamoyl transferase component Bud32